MKTLLTLIIAFIFLGAFAQEEQPADTNEQHKYGDTYEIVDFYTMEKVAKGSIDENSNPLRELFIPTEADEEKFSVEIEPYSPVFYRIKKSNLFIEFRHPPEIMHGIVHTAGNRGIYREVVK